MYRNNYNNQRGGYSQQYTPYNGGGMAPYNQNYNGPRQRGYGNGKPPKKSGCKVSVMKAGNHQGEQCITGWNVSKRRGMVTFIATPYSKTQEVTSKSNKQWQNWMVKLTFKDQLQERIVGGMYEVATGRLIMSEIGMVANPRTNYFGTMFRKK